MQGSIRMERDVPMKTRDGVILRTLLQGYVERGEVSGVSLLLAQPGNIVFEEAYGWADIEGEKPFTTDTIVSIASTTKPISATCLMILVDEGKISLDDPVSKYLPAFEGLRIAGTEVKAASPTIRQLPSHTSGIFAHPMTRAEMGRRCYRPHPSHILSWR